MSRLSPSNTFNRHDCLEEIYYSIPIWHEPLLILKPVQEDIIALQPYFMGARCNVHTYLPLNLIIWHEPCYPKVRLTELTVPPTPSHCFNNTMYACTNYIWYLFYPWLPPNPNPWLNTPLLYIMEEVCSNMICFPYHCMINHQIFLLLNPELELPCSWTSNHNLEPITIPNTHLLEHPCKIDEVLLVYWCEVHLPSSEHHAHRGKSQWIHCIYAYNPCILIYILMEMLRMHYSNLIPAVALE
ncbi:hypothetical protein HRbin04_00346 [archaeon HR04]|nr:hypothetical protein HRbin04_00346 [archaeon HR04]